MISICIPIYNHYVYPLVRRLSTQIEKQEGEFEIVCIDDHSSGYFITQNKSLAELSTYIRLAENIGRARIRNLFLKYAKGDYLLFLDNDVMVGDRFLKKYVNTLAENPSVVVGGVKYDERCNDIEHRLRYLYGTKVETRSADQRRSKPYRSFLTGNFMVRRDVFEKIRFDSKIKKYGHEDTLFGYQLEQNKIPILHIDNPVNIEQIETNAEFLHKSVESVESLSELYDRMWEDQYFCHTIRLLNTYAKLRRLHMLKPTYWLYKMFRSPMEAHFVSGNAISITQFNFYKLGKFIEKQGY